MLSMVVEQAFLRSLPVVLLWLQIGFNLFRYVVSLPNVLGWSKSRSKKCYVAMQHTL